MGLTRATIVVLYFFKKSLSAFLMIYSNFLQRETIWKIIQFWNHVQRDFADDAFCPTSMWRFSIVIVMGGDKLHWFVQVLHLFHIETIGVRGDHNETGFVKYFEITLLLDKFDEILDCTYMFEMGNRWQMDHSYIFDSYFRSRVEAREWFGLVPFSTIRSVPRVVMANYFSPIFSEKIPSSIYQFEVNRFHTM